MKGFSFSGESPDESLSENGESLLVGGLRWFPNDDYLMLNIGKINFSRKIRGRKVENISDIPECLTKKLCVSVSAEVFDPTGRVAPILGGIKLDISNLHKMRCFRSQNQINFNRPNKQYLTQGNHSNSNITTINLLR